MIRAAAYRMKIDDAGIGTTKRELILHDSLTFLVLGAATLALFGVTLFLFRSFESHRADLAKSFAEQGKQELLGGKPMAAIDSLRASLGYAPDDYATQLLLARSLAEAGEIDQATNYFLNLREARPGDGFLNLQLARLERKRGNRPSAIAYYRASIFGDWRGDGSIKRRDVRLELVDYFIETGNYAAARVELLIAAGNAPDNLPLTLLFADKLRAVGDTGDSLAYFEKAIREAPNSAAALEGAGGLLYDEGHYAQAAPLLERAEEASGAAHRAKLTELARDAERLVELSLSRELPSSERAEHIATAAKIARTRVQNCAAVHDHGSQLQDLTTRWRAAGIGTRHVALAENASEQDALTDLIFESERQSAQLCGPPTGDDALLLKLAEQSGAEQASHE